jgi:hypothetical protein
MRQIQNMLRQTSPLNDAADLDCTLVLDEFADSVK